MKLEYHVENIRLKVESAVKNTLDRYGITEEIYDYHNAAAAEIHIGNVSQLIESIKPEKSSWKEVYQEVVDDYAFTLFNRLVCMKVLESHGLYPEMITQKEQHSGKSYGHYMWLESYPEYNDTLLEGLAQYIEWQYQQLENECDLFKTDIPLHMIPTAISLKEIIDSINAVDDDSQVDDEVWKEGNILSQIYEIYNNSKKAALKTSGDKVEYDKVHIQSQIYTPEWVVQFLVDNSLGKMYMEMYPDSCIAKNHKIIGEFNNSGREKKPLDEIKVIDPCVGSGNFLLYCYDLFYEMYMEQIDNYGAEYSKREVPSLIIEKNLYGIDLDERAVQLTKVGLFIKAKTKRNTVKIQHYNVSSASFRLPSYEQAGFMFDAKFFSKDFAELVADVWKDLQQAHKFGSLLRIDEKYEIKRQEWSKDITDTKLSLFNYKKAVELDTFEKDFYEKLEKMIVEYATDDKRKYFISETTVALAYLKIMVGKYDVVASNPPYTDSASISGTMLSDFLEVNYKKPMKFTGNLYAAFYKRNYEFLNEFGFMAMIHPLTFMYIPTFDDMRKHLLQNMSISIFVEYGLSNLFGLTMVDPAFYVLTKKKYNGEIVPFISLDQYTRTSEEKFKNKYCVDAIDNIILHKQDRNVVYVKQDDFKKIEGYPIIYNISEEFRDKFTREKLIKYADVRAGIQTSKNERFLRLWWEVGKENIRGENDFKRWVLYAKGGPYVKWYGNNWCAIDWSEEGKSLQRFLKENGQDLHAQEYYFREGITYSASGSKGITFREHSKVALFDIGGSCVFPTIKFGNTKYLMALLNSRLSEYILKDCLNPTVNTQPKDLKRLPFVIPTNEIEKEITKLADDCIKYKKNIDISYFINGANMVALDIVNTVRNAVIMFVEKEISLYCKILINEALIDECICNLYELSEGDLKMMTDKKGECVANLPVYVKAIELFIQEFEMDGKYFSEVTREDYSDEELAEIESLIQNVLYQKNNEIEDFCSLNNLNPIMVWYLVKTRKIIPTVKAKQLSFEWLLFALEDMLNDAEDGIISLCDTDTSILALLQEYADAHGITSAQLLQFEEFVGKKLKAYCEQDFFLDLMNYTNVFMYLPKTPFIWHLSSGEYRGFEVFILIYKWSRDSLYTLKSKHISKRRERLEFRKTQLANVNTAQAISEKELIDKQLKEIEIFVTKLDELIAQGYEPKLDDGVGKNIAPLQDKKMLKADVLNPNQLKKYLKAEW